MVHFSTLGRIDLTGPDDCRIQSILQQPKRLAILAYLALEGRGGPVRRDRILALMWPDCDEATAKSRLKRAVHFLRASLGRGVLPRDGSDSLRLDPASFTSDAADFLEAYEAGRWGDALARYHGELLPGFHVDDSGEFDSWLEGQRHRLGEAAAESAMHVAREAAHAGDAAAASRAVSFALNRLCGAARLREGIELLATLGDRALVAEALEAYESRLEDELGFELDPELLAWAADLIRQIPPPEIAASTLPQRADLPASALAETPPNSDASGRLNPETPGPQRSWAARPTLLAAVLAAVLLVPAAAMVWGDIPRLAAGDVAADAEMILTLQPFDTFDGSEVDGELLHSLLWHQLIRNGVRLIPADDPRLNGVAAGSSSPLALQGLIRRVRDEFAAEMALIRTDHRRAVWTRSFHWSSVSPDLDSVARVIASELQFAVRHQERAWGGPDAGFPSEALELARLGESAQRYGRAQRARGLLDVADLAFSQADSMFARAATLAPDWTEPLLGRTRLAQDRAWLAMAAEPAGTAELERHFEAGIRFAGQVIESGRNNAEALEARGFLAVRMAATVPMKADRRAEILTAARADLEQAVTLDRDRGRAWSMLSGLAFSEGDFARALWLAQTAYDVDPHRPYAREVLMRLMSSAFELGDDRAAEQWCGEIRRRFPGEPTAAVCRLSLLAWKDSSGPGDVDDAWRALDEVAGPSGDAVRPHLKMLVASVIARSSLADSAEAVVQRALLRAGGDPEFLHLEAHVRGVLGQRDTAVELLDRWVELNTATHGHVPQSRRFSALHPPRAER
jgi:DNA-binding SARP family transcriptional activator